MTCPSLNFPAAPLVVVVGIVCVLELIGCSGGPTRLEIDEARSLMKQLTDAGVVNRYSCGDRHEVFVAPRHWEALPADSQRGLAMAAAAVCVTSSMSGYRTTVIEHQTGRKLASFSEGDYQAF